MESLIEERDLNGIKAFTAKVQGTSQHDVLVAVIERSVRELAMELIRKGGDDLEEQVRQHLQFVIELCKEGVCNKNMAVLTMNDMMDVGSIDVCKKLFAIVEETMPQFKQPPLVEASQTYVLRMCNDLLKRLSRTVETSFCGRVLSFLSKYLPLGEKSGLNLNGQFNTQNTTKYETGATEFTELLSAPQDENAETGEIVEAKESLIPVDSEFYQKFWKLQSFFSNPGQCYDSDQWPVFQKSLTEVAATLSSHKLEKSSGDYGRSSKRRREEERNAKQLADKAERYFAKYLTSHKLLQLQLNDSQFRRNFLVQALIVVQYLTAEVRFKAKSQELPEEKKRFCLEIQDKCYKLLRETQPKGSHFVDYIKSILSREKDWSNWKNQNCYDMEKDVEKTAMLPYRKRPRTDFNPNVVDLGTSELTKLWSIEPDILKFCKDSKRKFTPTVEKFIEDPIDELDPEQQVEDEYKSIHNAAFQWRAGRFLMAEAEEYWTVKNEVKEYTTSMSAFLEKVILRAGGKEHFLKKEVVEEKKEAPEEKNKEEPNPKSPPGDAKVSDEALRDLSIVLAKEHHLKDLIPLLNNNFERKSEEDKEDSVKRLVLDFAESKQYSVRGIANGLLAAGLISEDVTKALNGTFKAEEKTSSLSSLKKKFPFNAEAKEFTPKKKSKDESAEKQPVSSKAK